MCKTGPNFSTANKLPSPLVGKILATTRLESETPRLHNRRPLRTAERTTAHTPSLDNNSANIAAHKTETLVKSRSHTLSLGYSLDFFLGFRPSIGNVTTVLGQLQLRTPIHQVQKYTRHNRGVQHRPVLRTILETTTRRQRRV